MSVSFKLVLLRKGLENNHYVFVLKKKKLYIGSNLKDLIGHKIQLPDARDAISPQHAEIFKQGSKVLIANLTDDPESVLVNGTKVTSKPQELKHRDLLQIGAKVFFRYILMDLNPGTPNSSSFSNASKKNHSHHGARRPKKSSTFQNLDSLQQPKEPTPRSRMAESSHSIKTTDPERKRKKSKSSSAEVVQEQKNPSQEESETGLITPPPPMVEPRDISSLTKSLGVIHNRIGGDFLDESESSTGDNGFVRLYSFLSRMIVKGKSIDELSFSNVSQLESMMKQVLEDVTKAKEVKKRNL